MNEHLIGGALVALALVAYFAWLWKSVLAQEADARKRPEYYKMLASIDMSESPVETLAKNARYESEHGSA